MKTYRIVGQIAVPVVTFVDAETVEQALAIAKTRPVQPACHWCNGHADETWCQRSVSPASPEMIEEFEEQK